MGGAVRPELMNESDESLSEKAWRDVVKLLHLQTKPIWQQVIRWNAAMPQYLINHNELVSEIELRTNELSGLALAGNAYKESAFLSAFDRPSTQ